MDMSEFLHVERPFRDQFATLSWTVIDQGYGMIPYQLDGVT